MSTHLSSASLVRKIIAIALIGLLCASQTPSTTAAAILQTATQYLSEPGGWATSALEVFGVYRGGAKQQGRGLRPSPPPTKAQREAQVAALELNVASELVLRPRQRIMLAAIPVDGDGKTIHGLNSVWKSSNKQVVSIKENGDTLAGKAGMAILTARAGNKQVTVNVNVVNEQPARKKRIDSTRRPRQPELGSTTPTNSASSQKQKSQAKRAHANAKTTVSNVLPFIRDPNDDPLPDSETSSLYQPNNLIGAPPGKKKPGAITAAAAVPTTENGIRNFAFGMPVVELPGRQMALSLSLIYNSLVWNKSTNPSDSSTWMTYDVDSGFPAQGFRLGYGQLEDQGSAGYTFTESEGTRHALVLISGNTYETTDGSFIRFHETPGGGTLLYPDGTRVYSERLVAVFGVIQRRSKIAMAT